MTTWQVAEIFSSIDGEGVRAGQLASFVRLAGCNLRCAYCDTTYALDQASGRPMTLNAILEQLRAYACPRITLTGGEPLAAPNALDLVTALCQAGFEVNIETNGSMDIRPYVSLAPTIVTMDYKTPSSGSRSAMRMANLPLLRPQDVLKIVLQEADFDDVRALLATHSLPCAIYLSPIYGAVQPARIVEFMQDLARAGADTARLRMQLQLHKYIWPPDMRGV